MEFVWILTEHDGRVSTFGDSLGWRVEDEALKALDYLNKYRAADRKMKIHRIALGVLAEKSFFSPLDN